MLKIERITLVNAKNFINIRIIQNSDLKTF